MSPTDTDLEPLLAEALRAKAAQIPDVVEPFAPTVVNLGDGERRRRSPLFAAAAMVVLVIAVAVGLAIALRDGDGARPATKPAVPPTGRNYGHPTVPVARLEIDALPTLTFQAKEFTTVPGVNEINFISRGGTHQLRFADRSLSEFKLAATSEAPAQGDVELQAGRDYTIYCAISGHRAAGMEAVIHVRSRSNTP